MKLYFTTTKKGLFVLIFVLVAALFIIAKIRSLPIEIDGSTHQKRIDYLKTLKLEVEENRFSSKEIIIPAEFGEVYKEYNSIQKKAGFDLSLYKGQTATLYTYNLGAAQKVGLMVCQGKIIGGEIRFLNAESQPQPLLRQ